MYRAGWLAGDYGAIFSWVTGWFNLLGQIAVTASIASALVTLTRSAIILSYGYAMTPAADLAFYGGASMPACPELSSTFAQKLSYGTGVIACSWLLLLHCPSHYRSAIRPDSLPRFCMI